MQPSTNQRPIKNGSTPTSYNAAEGCGAYCTFALACNILCFAPEAAPVILKIVSQRLQSVSESISPPIKISQAKAIKIFQAKATYICIAVTTHTMGLTYRYLGQA
jgi:hypothetical protein